MIYGQPSLFLQCALPQIHHLPPTGNSCQINLPKPVLHHLTLVG